MKASLKRTLLALAMLAAAAGSAGAEHGQPSPQPQADQRAVFRFASALYGLDPDLLEAIASVESGGDPSAVSPKGAQGLMQIMPATGKCLGLRKPFDPVQNTLAAARFLAYLRWWQLGRPWRPADLPEVLAAYNAGPGAVRDHGGIPPYPETEDYVRKILIRYLFGRIPPAGLSARPRAADLLSRRSAPAASRANPDPAVDALDQLSEIKRLRAQAERRRLNHGVP